MKINNSLLDTYCGKTKVLFLFDLLHFVVRLSKAKVIEHC